MNSFPKRALTKGWLSLLLLLPFAPAQADPDDPEVVILTAWLEPAYRQADSSFRSPLLEEFLDHWHRRYPPTEQEDRLRSDTLAAAYDLISDIVQPCKMRYIRSLETGRAVDSIPYRYFTFQDSLRLILRADDDFLRDNDSGPGTPPKPEKRICIPFRPEITYAKSLYLNRTYACALDRFLGNREENTEKLEAIPDLSVVESWHRGDFLLTHIPIVNGHWGGWIYAAEPRCFFIVFNASLDRAIADIGYSSYGSINLYRKVNGRWELEKEIGVWCQ